MKKVLFIVVIFLVTVFGCKKEINKTPLLYECTNKIAYFNTDTLFIYNDFIKTWGTGAEIIIIDVDKKTSYSSLKSKNISFKEYKIDTLKEDRCFLFKN